MTIICALHRDGQTWIGSDTMAVQSGNRKSPYHVEKWAVSGSTAIAIAGDLRLVNLIHRYADEILKPDNIHDIVERFRQVMKDDGMEPQREGFQGGALAWNHAAIIADPKGVYCVDSTFAYVRFPDGVLCASGSGLEYAIGAAHALSGFALPAKIVLDIPTEKIVTAAVEAAIRNDNGCGGRTFVRKLPYVINAEEPK